MNMIKHAKSLENDDICQLKMVLNQCSMDELQCCQSIYQSKTESIAVIFGFDSAQEKSDIDLCILILKLEVFKREHPDFTVSELDNFL